MEIFKLNFYRFGETIEIADLEVGVSINDSGLSSTAQKVVSTYGDVEKATEKLIEANEKLATSSTSARTSLKTINENNVRRFNASLGVLKTQMQSPFASDKIKVTGSSKLAQLKNMGMDNMLIKNAGDLTATQGNRVLSQTNQINNMVSREAIYQQKEMANASKIALSALEKENMGAQTLKGTMNELGSETDKTAEKTLTFGQKMSKAFDKLKHYAVSWRIIYGVFQSIWNTLSDTFKKAAAYQEALNLYTVAMGEYAEAGNKWSERISSALHLDPKQIMQYTGALYNLVQGLGVSSDAAYTMSTNLTQLAYDMSSYLNIDVESAYAKLQSAMTGQSRAVASAGIAMQQASLQELAYRLGIKKEVAEMTQAEKTYLRYIQIMRSTSNMQTDLARTIITPENAIRVVKQQFELLGRAIGQVFIPIVMKAIPYVMALTQMLTQLANRLSSLLGFQFAKIDYDYLNLREVDTAVEDTMDNVAASAGNAAKSIGSSINRTLAAFDELNVVESESGGGSYPGSGGLGGTTDNILGDLEKYITGYDMLEGLTQDLDKQTEEARKNLEKLLKVALPIGALFAIWKGTKWIKGLMGIATSATAAYNAGTGLMGVLKKLVTGLTTVYDKLVYVFGGMGGLFAAIFGSISAFFGAKDMLGINWLSDETTHFEKILRVLGDTVLVVGGILLASLTGPIGLAIAAIAAVTGGVIGFINSTKKLEEELRAQMQLEWEMKKAIEDREYAMEHSFNNGGIHLESFVNKFKESIPPIEQFAEKIGDVSTRVEEADRNTNESALAFLNLHNQIVMGTNDDEIIKKLSSATNTFKESLKESEEAHIKFHTTVLDNLKEEKKITETEYNERLGIVKKYYQQSTLYQSKYADEVSKLDTKLKNGKITQEEYDIELQKIMDKYNGLIPSTELLSEATGDLQLIMSRKIDFGSFEEAEEQINDLKIAYQTADEQFKTSRKNIEDEYNKSILGLEKDNEKIKQLLLDPSLSDARRKQLTEQMNLNTQMLEQSRKTRDDELAILTDKHTKMKAQYKNYMANILAQMVQNKLDTQEEAKSTVAAVEEELRALGDIDLTQAGDDALGSYFNGMLSSEEKARPKLRMRLYDNGIDISDALWSALRGEIPSQVNETEDYWNNAIEIPLDRERKKAEEEGRSFISKYTTGMFKNIPWLTSTVDNVMAAAQTEVDKKPLVFKMNTNLNSSYNTILRGFQSFANNKWGPAVDNLMGNTSSVFGGLKLSGLTSLVVSKFKGINIKLYGGGGYPTSGDLFFANENGRAEYITSLGNRTAVANQDQMVSALTNAILQGMSAIETSRQPNHIVVNLGNEKLYEGQGTYQNRQADRYGTTYVQI